MITVGSLGDTDYDFTLIMFNFSKSRYHRSYAFKMSFFLDDTQLENVMLMSSRKESFIVKP